jgi:phosphoglycerate kinase
VPTPNLDSLLQAGVQGQRVLVRSDLNVPLEGSRIRDDTRIRKALPTLRRLTAAGARVVLTSHLGRPKGKRDPAASLRPVAARLGEHLGTPVSFISEFTGAQAKKAVSELRDGEIVLLENLRFDPGETANDPAFAQALASLADAYVNDAFGTAHRAHASTVGVAERISRCAAGDLLATELRHLQVVREPERPLLVLLGGAKVSDKLAVLEALAPHAEVLAIGGAMTYTFMAARGEAIGASRFEPERVEDARRIEQAAASAGRRLLLPSDHVVAESLETGAAIRVVEEIPDGWLALDIGPETATRYAKEAGLARTIFWNGPMGMFERDEFANGTRTVAAGIAAGSGTSVVGGGDSLAAINQLGLADRIDHLSTGGGASLEFVQGLTLPGVEALGN